MQSIEHINYFLKKYYIFWLGAIGLGVVAGLIIANNLKPTYQGVMTANFTSNPSLSQLTTPFYLYDNYYGLIAANKEKANYLQWLTEPATIQAIYTKAQIKLPSESAASLAKTFVTLSSDQSNGATITVSRNTESEARKMMQAVADTSKTFPGNAQNLIFSEPFIQPILPSKFLVTLGVTLAFFVIIFVATLINDFFADQNRSK